MFLSRGKTQVANRVCSMVSLIFWIKSQSLREQLAFCPSLTLSCLPFLRQVTTDLWEAGLFFNSSRGASVACLFLWERTGKQWILNELEPQWSVDLLRRTLTSLGAFWTPKGQEKAELVGWIFPACEPGRIEKKQGGFLHVLIWELLACYKQRSNRLKDPFAAL